MICTWCFSLPSAKSCSLWLQSMLLFAAGSIGSAMLCYSIPYTPETLPAKLGAFTVFTSIMGLTLAPLIAIAGGCDPE